MLPISRSQVTSTSTNQIIYMTSAKSFLISVLFPPLQALVTSSPDSPPPSPNHPSFSSPSPSCGRYIRRRSPSSRYKYTRSKSRPRNVTCNRCKLPGHVLAQCRVVLDSSGRDSVPSAKGLVTSYKIAGIIKHNHRLYKHRRKTLRALL